MQHSPLLSVWKLSSILALTSRSYGEKAPASFTDHIGSVRGSSTKPPTAPARAAPARVVHTRARQARVARKSEGVVCGQVRGRCVTVFACYSYSSFFILYYITISGDQGKPGKPGHRNIGRGSCRSARADGVERRSTAVVRGYTRSKCAVSLLPQYACRVLATRTVYDVRYCYRVADASSHAAIGYLIDEIREKLFAGLTAPHRLIQSGSGKMTPSHPPPGR